MEQNNKEANQQQDRSRGQKIQSVLNLHRTSFGDYLDLLLPRVQADLPGWFE